MKMLSDRHFCDEIRRQTSLEAAAAVLAELAMMMGWDLAAFHADIDATDLPRTRSGAFIAETMGWPFDCLDGWRRFELGRHCPIASQCGRAAGPFYWTCDEADRSWFEVELAPEACKVINHYGRYVADGIAVPVRLRKGGTGYVSWCSRRGQGRERAEAHLGSMFLISQIFIRHAECLIEEAERADRAGRLTARELECLTWAAHGKNEEEIARLIHRSRDTVHFHLRNAAIKLNAANRTHAVAIACTQGLIHLRPKSHLPTDVPRIPRATCGAV